MVRPELFLIQDTPQAVKAEVERSVFEGGRYRVYLSFLGQRFMVYHSTGFAKGDTVFVTYSQTF